MGRTYARTMFHESAKRLQQLHGSRAAYEKQAERGQIDSALTEFEVDFIAARDSFYLGTVTDDSWPYIQHRGGPTGFLRVIDPSTLAFADFAGNKQYISAGNFVTNNRVALFLMDYPSRTRLKLLGHASVVDPTVDPDGFQELAGRVAPGGYPARVERIVKIALKAFDWNCPQHITPRYTAAEVEQALALEASGERSGEADS